MEVGATASSGPSPARASEDVRGTAPQPQDIEIRANGIRQHGLEWSVGGRGQLVIFLHGVGSNCWHWDPLAQRLLGRFGARLRLVALDHRGCGDSERPPSGYSPDICAADVLEAAKELGGGPPILIGHSRGGWMTAYLAGHHPASVRQAILVDPARMTWRSMQAVDDFYDRIRQGIGPFHTWDDAVAAAKAREPEAIWTEARLRGLKFGLHEVNGMIAGKMPPFVLEQLREVRLDDVVGPYLEKVIAPTLVLVAMKSNGLRQADKLAYVSGITHSQVKKFDTSHYMHQDAPDEIAECIGDFIDSHLDDQLAANGEPPPKIR